jgi:hypothetical protein
LDASPLRDPAGLVARTPELARLAERSPSLRRAIELGRPLDAYRALWWSRWRRRFGDLNDLAESLLAHRRLFIKPLGSAPTMFTYNGIGTRLYGRSELDVNDGTFVATLFAVVVFIPVLPIASYLVRDSAEKPGRAWNFMAKVPLSASRHLWQRTMALGAVAMMLFGVSGALEGYGHNTLHVVNGLSRPVSVQLGDASSVVVPGGQEMPIRTTTGKHPLSVRVGDRIIESATVEVPRGHDAVAWNVLGAAPLYVARVVYSSKDDSSTPQAPDPEVLCGRSFVQQGGVDYVFREPDKSLSMPEGSSATTKLHLGVASGGKETCLNYYSQHGEGAAAARLDLKVARALLLPASELDEDVIRLELSNLPSAEAEDFAKELVARDDSVDAHRLYQDVLIDGGQRSRAVAEYSARLASHPGSPDAEYLSLRARPMDEQRKTVDALVARFPDHVYLRRIHVLVHYAQREFAPMVESAEALRRLAPPVWVGLMDEQAEALLGLGRGDSALTMLLGFADDASQAGQARRHAKMIAYRVANRIGAPLPVVPAEPDDGEVALFVRAATGVSIPASEVASIKDPDGRETLEIVAEARARPDQALARLRRASHDVALRLPFSVSTLLLGEAARRDDRAVLDKLTGGEITKHTADAMVSFVQRGENSEEVAGLPLEIRAALEFARSRAGGITEKERSERLEEAKASDIFRGPVSVAIAAWPS